MSPKRILVIKLRSLGDTVLLTAPIKQLQVAYPRAEIHVVVTAAWASLLEQHPSITKIWPYERRNQATARAKAVARLAFQLRRVGFDIAVNFHASPSSAMLAFGSGAKVRSIHFHGLEHRNQYSTVQVPGKATVKPIIERDMDAVRALGIQVPEGKLPQIFLNSDEFVRGEQYVQNLGLRTPLLGLGLGASRITKIWPMDRFAALAITWVSQQNGSALALAGPGEDHLISEFMNCVDDQLRLQFPDETKRTTLKKQIAHLQSLPLRHLAAVIRQCSVFAANDSGPKHIAVAVNTPTVSIVGPEHPYEWHPYPTDIHPYLFVEDLPCRKDQMPGMPPWCVIDPCVVENHKCMKLIRVEQVLDECKRVAQV